MSVGYLGIVGSLDGGYSPWAAAVVLVVGFVPGLIFVHAQFILTLSSHGRPSNSSRPLS